jgi:AAA15 family ATPase/GTPase
MERFVLKSAESSRADESIDVSPFGSRRSKTPTSFEVIFIHDDVRYQYGFSVTTTQVLREWLYAYPEGRQQLWFERKKNIWRFGSLLRGAKSTWRDATRRNALLLSTAVQLNAAQLTPVFHWFRRELWIITSTALMPPFHTSEKCQENAAFKKNIMQLMNSADLGISDLRVHKHKFEITRAVASSMPKELQEAFVKSMGENEVEDISFVHRTEAGAQLDVRLEDESSGTQKVFSLAARWLSVLGDGGVLVVDELDTSLHPSVMRMLVSLFHNPLYNKKGAQLIFSTHDATLMDNSLFRRDQIWFVEKDRNLESHLYPLSDFSPRKGEDLEKGYLRGRYGAIPFIGASLTS